MVVRRCHLLLLLLAAVAYQASAQPTKAVEFGPVSQDRFEATSAGGIVAPGFTLTANYNRDGTPLAVTCVPPASSVFSLGKQLVTCTASIRVLVNGKNETIGGLKEFEIEVVDTTPPVLTVPANIVVPASGSATDVPFAVTAVDVVDGAPSIFCSSTKGDQYTAVDANLNTKAIGLPVTNVPGGTPTSITCIAVDNFDNKSLNQTFTITVEDKVAPVITSNTTKITIEATGPGGAVLPNIITVADIKVTDNASANPPALTCRNVPANDLYPLGTTSVVCTATDPSGNSATITIIVEVVDTTPPALSQPPNLVVEATGPAGASVPFTAPTATDAVTPSPRVTCTSAPSSTELPNPVTVPITEPETTITVTCTTVDNAGNSASTSFTITVQDTTPPKMPDNSVTIFLENENTATFPGFPNKDATDIVDGNITITCDRKANDLLALGNYTANCSATDRAGNKAEAEYPIIVLKPATELTITVPSSDKFEAENSAGVVKGFTVTAADKATASTKPLTISCTAVGTNPAGPVTGFPAPGVATTTTSSPTATTLDFTNVPFTIQKTTVTCTATNFLNEKATASFTYEVVDTTPPVVVITITSPQPAPAQPGGTPPGSTPVTFTVTATDKVDPNPKITCNSGSNQNITGPFPVTISFPIGSSLIVCEAVDTSNNKGSSNTTAVVEDNTACVFDAFPDQTLTTQDPSGLVVNYIVPNCTDSVFGNIPPTCTPAPGTKFPVGSTNVTCTSTDPANNTATTTAIITVVDICQPTISGLEPITVEAASPTGTNVSFTVTAEDCSQNSLNVTCDPASGSLFPYVKKFPGIVSTNVSCSATAANGKNATTRFVVNVQDTTPPVIPALPGVSAQAGPTEQVAVTFENLPDAIDIVDGRIPINSTRDCVPASGTVFDLGNTTVTCSATDTAGNRASQTFTVTVTLKPPPAITCPADIKVDATKVENGTGVALVSFSVSSVADVSCSVGGNPVTSPVKVSLLPGFKPNTVTVSCRVLSDPRSTCDFKVTVEDKTPCELCGKKDLVYDACKPSGVDVCEELVAKAYGSDNLSPKKVVALCRWENRNCRKGSCTFPVGTTKIFCDGFDSAGNNCSTSFKVVVRDRRPPHINVCPIVVNAASAAGTRVTSLRERVTDNVDRNPTVTYRLRNSNTTLTLPFTFPLGRTDVVIRAVDFSGNVAERTTYVKVVDRVCPNIRAIGNVVRTATDRFGVTIANFNGQCVATDNITPANLLPIRYSRVGRFPVGKTWVRCSTCDQAGNCAQSGFIVEVRTPLDTCRSLQSHIAIAPPTSWCAVDTHALCGCVQREERVKACSLCIKVRGAFRLGSFGRSLADRLHSELSCGSIVRPFRKL